MYLIISFSWLQAPALKAPNMKDLVNDHDNHDNLNPLKDFWNLYLSDALANGFCYKSTET